MEQKHGFEEIMVGHIRTYRWHEYSLVQYQNDQENEKNNLVPHLT